MDSNPYSKKICGTNTCSFLTPAEKDKNAEEKEIKMVDLCNDPTCSNVNEKKLVDMSQGLCQLENILKNMTGLCNEPKCVSKTASVQKQVEDNRFSLPQPNRYITEDYTTGNKTDICKANQDQGYSSTKKAAFDPEIKYPQLGMQEGEGFKKICKGSVCYNAYMGYSLERKKEKEEPHVCDSFSCIPKPKPEKKICAAVTCPFSIVEKSERPKFSLFGDFDTTPKTKVGPCGGFECYPKTEKYPSLSNNKPLSDALDSFTNFAAARSSLRPSKVGSPIRVDNELTAASEGLCGRSSCPFAGMENESNNTPVSSTGAVCGNPTCPYSTPSAGVAVGLCGRTSCPYATVTSNTIASPCCNAGCNAGDTTYPQVGVCGQTECPMFDKTSPKAIKPCPYADRMKRYPCGSPSCPYVNPSGILQTHEYGNDRSYVQEAARPYCGSASPYDYMSSLTPTYPSPYATNYPLFSHTEPPAGIPPCPFLPKKQKKSCGSPTCPYNSRDNKKSRQQKDNFCIEKTCPFQEGVCGAPRMFSCDGPESVICGGPDCPIQPPPKEEEICCCCGRPKEVEEVPDRRKKKSCSIHREMEDLIPERDICGDPDCKPRKKKKKEICGSMDCSANRDRRVSEATTRSLYNGSYGSQNPEGEEDHEPRGDPGKCSSKTCPYLKKLVFCDDCGGVLPDEDTPSSSYTTFDTEEGSKQEPNKPEERSASPTSSPSPTSPSPTSPAPTSSPPPPSPPPPPPVKQEVVKYVKPKKDDEVPPPPKKPPSLYSYPGVQIGHKTCSYRPKKIPRNMGWLWNILPTFGNPELWRGYKPGAICKTVYKMIMKHRLEFDPTSIRKKRSRSRVKIDDTKHCIEVKKREGDYHIVVNPVKNPAERDITDPADNPYMDVTPIQFKIEKAKILNDDYCPCDDGSEEGSEATTEFDFHFTPPAGVPETILKKKKILAECGAQYDEMDLPAEFRGRKSRSRRGSSQKGKKGKKK